MEIDYSSNKFRKLMKDAAAIKTAFGANAKKISMRLDEIQAAPNLEILCQLPAANCHCLKGNRVNDWAVTISVNHRLIFEINQEQLPRTDDNSIEKSLVTKVLLKGVEDYH